MRKLLLFVIALGAFFSAFSATKKKKKAGANEIVSINMHRTVCYGRCPDYSIELSSDGTLVYTAIRFTEDSGIFKRSIGAKKAAEIIAQFKENRVDTCREMYENRIPDLPGLIYTIKYGGKTQKIFNANFGPFFLKELAEKMDEIGVKHKGDKGWKKIGMPVYK